MKRPQPLDHFLRGLCWTRVFVIVGHRIHQDLDVWDFDPAKRIIEEQIEVEFERPWPVVRLELEGLDIAQPSAQFAPKMLARQRAVQYRVPSVDR